MGYMNSKVFDSIINMLNPTLAFPIDTIGNAPYMQITNNNISDIVKGNIELSKLDLQWHLLPLWLYHSLKF